MSLSAHVLVASRKPRPISAGQPVDGSVEDRRDVGAAIIPGGIATEEPVDDAGDDVAEVGDEFVVDAGEDLLPAGSTTSRPNRKNFCRSGEERTR